MIIIKICITLIVFSSVFALTDKDIIQQMLNGAFEENKLQKPTTIMTCFDDTSANKTVIFINETLYEIAHGSQSFNYQTLYLPVIVKKFIQSLDQHVQQCLYNNEQVDSFNLKYNPDHDSFDKINDFYFSYVITHLLTVRKWYIDLDDTWNISNYYQVGFKAARYFHNILGTSFSKSIKKIKQSHSNKIMKILNQIHNKKPISISL